MLQFEEMTIDPLATITEVVSSLKNDELIWLQLLVRPLGPGWVAIAKGTVDELTGKKGKGGKGVLNSSVEFTGNLMKAPMIHPEWSEAAAGSAILVSAAAGAAARSGSGRSGGAELAFDAVL